MLAPFTTINETDNLPHITTNDNPLIVPSEILWELLHGRLPRSSWTCSLTVDSFTWKKLAEKTLGILQTLHSYQDLPLYLSRSPKCGLFLGTVKQDSPVQATQPVIASCQYHPRLKWPFVGALIEPKVAKCKKDLDIVTFGMQKRSSSPPALCMTVPAIVSYMSLCMVQVLVQKSDTFPRSCL